MIGGLISDDSRIVEAHIRKRYATEDDRPGADVALWYADVRLATTMDRAMEATGG